MIGAAKTLFCFSICIASGAHATIFMCRDASGRTLTSDRPIPECADRIVREYGNTGTLKREIAAPLTAEQKREKQLQDDKKKAEAIAADEQKKSDRALSARYRSEEDITIARKRDTSVISDQIAQQKKALSVAYKDLIDAQVTVEAQKKKGLVSAGMQYKLDRADQTVRDLNVRVSDSEVELAQVHAKYDVTLQRYREIATASAR
ncbi:MAG: DUF4124 domain-containing protein [Herminiimonas sp.]|uniref:DUF4124 domain-containing protein n=1 Tax=Herminiimonas sp. TaxID=1926289 RepID=UPI002716F552|nr:DUF4124 domain-containing protein [Herminiimonas sp.]MDO9419068.1 DUF4124 domain-containing protein [Herminiimonas sp.]